MNYSRFINPISAARLASPIRKLTEIVTAGGPSMISFGAGAPNAGQFPFEQIDVKLRSGETITLSGSILTTALQYGPTQGLPDLLAYIKELQVRLHNPPTLNSSDAQQKLDFFVIPGSQDGICRFVLQLFEATLSPGDSILVEEPTYAGVLAGLKPLCLKMLAVSVDSQGLCPLSLKSLLSLHKNPAPRILYLQPNGSNPCGVTIPFSRRKEIYEMAEEHDLLIIEDAPYQFLEFSEEPPSSFLSMDRSGRVVRFDSFSKVLSAGIRIGFVSGPHAIIERIVYHLQVSGMQCSSLSQVLVLELFKRWGVTGFLDHAKRVAAFYGSQSELLLAAAERHLKGLAEWTKPCGGMFLWIKILGISDSNKMISEKAVQEKVVFAPGNGFFVDSSQPTPYLRASFSVATAEKMEEGMRRLAQLIREEQKCNS